MPVVIVDTEQAALMEAAFVMLEAALSARVKRVDPLHIISDSFELQAKKLATVRKLLQAADPPAWRELSPELRKKAKNTLWLMHREGDDDMMDACWEGLRQLVNAPAPPQS